MFNVFHIYQDGLFKNEWLINKFICNWICIQSGKTQAFFYLSQCCKTCTRWSFCERTSHLTLAEFPWTPGYNPFSRLDYFQDVAFTYREKPVHTVNTSTPVSDRACACYVYSLQYKPQLFWNLRSPLWFIADYGTIKCQSRLDIWLKQ